MMLQLLTILVIIITAIIFLIVNLLKVSGRKPISESKQIFIISTIGIFLLLVLLVIIILALI